MPTDAFAESVYYINTLNTQVFAESLIVQDNLGEQLPTATVEVEYDLNSQSAIVTRFFHQRLVDMQRNPVGALVVQSKIAIYYLTNNAPKVQACFCPQIFLYKLPVKP